MMTKEVHTMTNTTTSTVLSPGVPVAGQVRV